MEPNSWSPSRFASLTRSTAFAQNVRRSWAAERLMEAWFANNWGPAGHQTRRFVRKQDPRRCTVNRSLRDRSAYEAQARYGSRRSPALMRSTRRTSFALPEVHSRPTDGRDDGVAGARQPRQACLQDLRPGTYRFRVIASNNGDWNEQGHRSNSHAPAWYQTRAFV